MDLDYRGTYGLIGAVRSATVFIYRSLALAGRSLRTSPVRNSVPPQVGHSLCKDPKLPPQFIQRNRRSALEACELMLVSLVGRPGMVDDIALYRQSVFGERLSPPDDPPISKMPRWHKKRL